MVVVREFLEEISISNENPFLFPVQDETFLQKNTPGNILKPTFGTKTADDIWQVEEIFGVVVISLLVPFILGSNLLVFIAVRKFKRLQVPTNYFLVSLAAADIIIALVIPFVLAAEIHKEDIVNIYVCLAPNRILMMACGVSILSLAAIAYDRYTALANPLEYISIMTMKKIVLVITLSWVFSAGIAWIPLFGHWHLNIDSQTHPCSFKLLHSKAHTIFLSAIFAPACFAIFFCYFRIYIVARHHARAIAAVETSVQHNLQVRYIIKDTKYAKTLALVMGVFLFLWLPYLTCLFCEIISDLLVNDWVRNYLSFLALLNSGVNPWVYAFKNNEFRAAFKRILKEHFPSCNCGRSAPRRPSILSESSMFPGSNTSLSLSRTNTSSVTSTDIIHTLGIISEITVEEHLSEVSTTPKLKTGVFSAVPKLNTGDLSAVPKLNTGVFSTVPKLNTGDLSTVPKLNTGDLSSVPKLNTEDLSIAPKLNTGDLSTVPKLNTGVFSTVPKLNTGDLSTVPKLYTGDLSSVPKLNTEDLSIAPKLNTGDLSTVPKLNTGDLSTVPKLNTEDLSTVPKLNTGDLSTVPKLNTEDLSTVAKLNTGDFSSVPKLNTGDFSSVPKLNTGDLSTVPKLNTGDFSTVTNLYTGDFSTLPELNTGDFSTVPKINTGGFFTMAKLNTGDLSTVPKLNTGFLPGLFKSYIPNSHVKEPEDGMSSDETDTSGHTTDESHEECAMERAS